MVRSFLDANRLEFFWDRTRCTRYSDLDTRDTVYLKDLKKLTRRGYKRDRILFVDDSPEKLRRSYGNLVQAKPFDGDLNDHELPALGRYLTTLSAQPNVRTLEKRFWRSMV